MKKNERGQSLVIIAISFLALVAMAALVIDGGSLYLNRRNAQTAADAAAMAGARELCVNKGTAGTIQNIVDEYAITENGATAVENMDIDFTNKTVNVQTMLETSSFFAGILGYENNTVRAEAEAGCFSPKAEKLLPIAWSCQPPVGGPEEPCVIHSIPWAAFKTLLTVHNFGPGTDPNMLLDEDTFGDGTYQRYRDGYGAKMPYLVMDSDKFDYSDCKPPIGTTAGGVNCDFNNDGIVDVEGGADRGWLILGDKGGAAALKDIIRNGYEDPIDIPQWFTGKSGVSTSVFDAAAEIKGDLVLLPVFNAVCSGTTAAGVPTKCPTEYKAGDKVIDYDKGKKGTYYRVADFAPFVITCVSKGNSEQCPAKNFSKVKDNTKTIEGYFVSGYTGAGGIGPDGFGLGIYVISLTK